MALDMRQFASARFIKPADVEGGPIRSRIAFVKIGEKYGRPEITLANGDVLSLNKTNVRILIQAYGPNEVDWYDQEVEFYHGKFRDRETEKEEPTVSVRPISPPLPERAQTPLDPKDVAVRPATNGGGGNDMDDQIPF
jgi:hypothetical protein